ncbi:MAG: peptide deformylase [Bacteroidales bacterium]
MNLNNQISLPSNGGFSANEINLIHSGDGLMTLYTVENEAELHFLHQKAVDLSQSDLLTTEYKRLKDRMLLTVTNPDREGVGIAAPQVGVQKRLIAVQRLDLEGMPFRFYVNPVIFGYSQQKKVGSEGCLSVPDRNGNVNRSLAIKLRYLDEDTFEIKEEMITGFTAIIFQHEVDHLNGVLYIDKLEQKTEV